VAPAAAFIFNADKCVIAALIFALGTQQARINRHLYDFHTTHVRKASAL
jgi:hypothetical protein